MAQVVSRASKATKDNTQGSNNWFWSSITSDAAIAKLLQDDLIRLENTKRQLKEAQIERDRLLAQEINQLETTQQQQLKKQIQDDYQIAVSLSNSDAEVHNRLESKATRVAIRNRTETPLQKNAQEILTLTQQIQDMEKKIATLQKKVSWVTKLQHWMFFLLLLLFILFPLNNHFIVFPQIYKSEYDLNEQILAIWKRMKGIENKIITLETNINILDKECKALRGNQKELEAKYKTYEILYQQTNDEIKAKLEVLDKKYFYLENKRWVGCFFPGNFIQIDEDPSKQILVQLIKPGWTQIWNPITKKRMNVTRKVVGPEIGFRYQISTSSNHTVQVTKYHPMISYFSGNASYMMIPAYQLQVGDWTLTSFGPQIISQIELIPILESVEVYNFEIEMESGMKLNDRVIVANGLFTSDLWTQEHLKIY